MRKEGRWSLFPLLTLSNMDTNRPFPWVILAVLLILGISFTVYYFNRQKIGANTPSSNLVQTELIAGQTVSFKDNLLTVKKDNSLETQIKIAPGATILKQKRISSYDTSSVPAEVQAGDKVSVQMVTAGPGKGEANMVLILDDTVVSKEGY